MSFLGKFFAPIYVGMANGRFLQKKYDKAVVLYDKACKMDPRNERMEHIYSCLGRSYFGIGENKKAVEKLSKSYQLYKKVIRDIKGDFEKKEFKETLKAYAAALKNVGEHSKAKDIEIEEESFKTQRQRDLKY